MTTSKNLKKILGPNGIDKYLECSFCGRRGFEVPEGGFKPRPSSIICTACGKENDYSQVVKITEEKVMEILKRNAVETIDSMLS